VKALLAARIAWRQILSRSNSGFVRTVSLLSVAGIAIGVAALIILNSFMDGFSDNIMRQLSSINAPMEIRIPGGYVFGREELLQAEETAAGYQAVTGTSPVLEKTVVIAGNSGDVAGVRMRGIDWSVEPELVSGERLSEIRVEGRGAVLGNILAERLGVDQGDTVRLASTDVTQFSSMGRLLVDTIVAVRVGAVTDFGIEEYNSSLLLTDLDTAVLLFREPIAATTVSVGLADGADPVLTAADLTEDFRQSFISGYGEYMVCDSFISSHKNLFAALGLEKTGMTIVLALIGVVALLNLLSALTMIAIEHRRDIGVLRSMGAKPSMILMTGLFQGGIIGFGGAAMGSAFAIASITVINSLFPIRLESSVYWVDTLSGEMQPLVIAGIGIMTVFACFVASLFPAIRAVAVNPSEAVRYE
jgi:lipoprotein-releasing system permease protein